MTIFLDSEFTGLHQHTKLISIGLIDDNNNTFYAENCDFISGYKNDSDYQWAKEHIFQNLKFYDKGYKHFNNTINNITINSNTTEVFGNIPFIREALTEWLKGYKVQQEIWSDCLSYDWVLFNNIFGHAFKIPITVYYIPFDICTLFKIKNINPDIPREIFAGMTENAEKHNALWDAKVIKACYEKLQLM